MTVGEKSVNPLPDGTSLTKREPEKKDTLTGLRPVLSVHPANRIGCSSNIAIADHFPTKTCSFKHHLTGEAWRTCRAILPFHSNTT